MLKKTNFYEELGYSLLIFVFSLHVQN